MRQKGFAQIIVIILLLLLVGGGAYYFGTRKSNAIPTNIQTPAQLVSTTEPTTDPTANWKTYTNSGQKLTFKYPGVWTLDTSQDGGALNAIIALKKGSAQIKMYFRMDGIGGAGRDYEGDPFTLSGLNLFKYHTYNSYNDTMSIGLTSSLKQSLGVFEYGGATYSISMNYPNGLVGTEDEKALLAEFDQILSTFKFTQ